MSWLRETEITSESNLWPRYNNAIYRRADRQTVRQTNGHLTAAILRFTQRASSRCGRMRACVSSAPFSVDEKKKTKNRETV